MTRPTVIFFGPDGQSKSGQKGHNKVFLRTLLYSTARRGQVIESMHVNIQRGESQQNFSIWVYGDGDKGLVRGSGLYVGEDGITHNHHFILPEDARDFRFSPGEYSVRIFAKRVRDVLPVLLHEERLRVSDADAQRLAQQNAGLYFDWGPDQQAYHSHIDLRKSNDSASPLAFFEGEGMR